MSHPFYTCYYRSTIENPINPSKILNCRGRNASPIGLMRHQSNLFTARNRKKTSNSKPCPTWLFPYQTRTIIDHGKETSSCSPLDVTTNWWKWKSKQKRTPLRSSIALIRTSFRLETTHAYTYLWACAVSKWRSKNGVTVIHGLGFGISIITN